MEAMQVDCVVCKKRGERFGVPVLPKMNVSESGLLLGQQAQVSASFFAFSICTECVELGLMYLCSMARKAAIMAPAGPMQTAEVKPTEKDAGG